VKIKSILASSIVFMLASSTVSAQIKYSVLDLGSLGSDSTALGVNNLGQVVGFSVTADGAQHAFRTEPNLPINPATDDLGTLGGANSRALGINNSGQVVGYSYITGDNAFHAFRTAPNQAINPATDDLGTLGGTNSAAQGVNTSGQVVGYSFISGDSTTHPFRTVPNQAINPATDDLYPQEGSNGNGNVAYAINNSGQVVGYATPPSGNSLYYAFRSVANQTINYATDNLGQLGGQNGSQAYGVNSMGQVVGAAWLPGNVTAHAFRTEANQPINPATDDLGTLPGTHGSKALGINSSGVVVGFSYNPNDIAFVFSGNGPMQDLNSLIDPSLGVSLYQANAINDLGQIVGFGHFGDGNHAYLLTPVVSWLGASSTSWADSGNWSGPVPGNPTGTSNLDTAVFNQSALNSPLVIDAGRNLQNITFESASVSSMTVGTVGGNAMLLTAGGTIQTTATVVNPQTINAPLVLEGNYTFTSGASTSSATLSFGGRITPAVTSGVTTLTLNGSNTGPNTISGALSDNGSGQLAITMSGTGVWILSGNNTFTGGVTINSGVLSLGSAGALNSASPNGVAFGAGSTGTLALVGNSVTVGSLITNATAGNPIVENSGGTTATLTVNNVSSNTFAGVMQDGGSGPLSVIKTGSGTLTLTGFNTFTGGLAVNGGIVKLDAPGSLAVATACPVVVASGAELDLNQTDNVRDSPMTVNGIVNITGGGHQHLNLLTLNRAKIMTSGGSFAGDGQANYALDSSVTNVGGTADSVLSASIGIQLNASPTFNVAFTGDLVGDLIVTAKLRDAENGISAGFTKAGAGRMVLSANSTYTGTTTVSGGTLATTSTGTIGAGPLVVSAADSVTSAFNSGASQTISSLSGTLAGSGAARINVGSNVTLTVDQANDTTYAGAIALAAGVVAGRGGAFIKSSTGTVEIQSASSFANNSFVEVSGGKLRFNVAAGSTSVGTGVLALIDNDAVLELAGSVSALSSGNRGVDILNNSTAPAGVLVSGANQRVGGIDGSGSTQVNAGSDLSANHIVQSALLIGGTAASPALVTIDASDQSGNPLGADLVDASGLADSMPSIDFFIGSTDPLSWASGSPLNDLGSVSGTLPSVDASKLAVPEPSTIILLATVIAGALARRGLTSIQSLICPFTGSPPPNAVT
jgi:probable HAF family extracellular repeat protein/autotransporter-associated beta strand protein